MKEKQKDWNGMDHNIPVFLNLNNQNTFMISNILIEIIGLKLLNN